MKGKQGVHIQSIGSMHFCIKYDILLDHMLHNVTSCILNQILNIMHFSWFYGIWLHVMIGQIIIH